MGRVVVARYDGFPSDVSPIRNSGCRASIWRICHERTAKEKKNFGKLYRKWNQKPENNPSPKT